MRRDHNLINSYWKQGCPFTEVFTVVANKKFGREKPVPKYRRFWMFFGTRNQKKNDPENRQNCTESSTKVPKILTATRYKKSFKRK